MSQYPSVYAENWLRNTLPSHLPQVLGESLLLGFPYGAIVSRQTSCFLKVPRRLPARGAGVPRAAAMHRALDVRLRGAGRRAETPD